MARKSFSIEQNLILLSVAGLALFLALGGTVLFVQSALEGTQERINDVVVPAEERVAKVLSTVAELFEREAAVLGTRSTAELEKLDGVGDLHTRLGDSIKNLQAALSEKGRKQLAPEMDAAVASFMKSEADLYDRIKARHALQDDFDKNLAAIQVDLRGLIEASQSISGRVRLDFVIKLRQLAAKLDSDTLDAQGRGLARDIVLGDARGALDSMTELVNAILNLGVVTGKLGLARSEDDLNSIIGNEIAQSRAKIESRLEHLVELTAADPDANARATALRERFRKLAARVADEKEPTSLASLRRQTFRQSAEAIEVRAASRKSSAALSAAVADAGRDVRGLVQDFQDATRSTTRTSKYVSACVSILGLILCLIAAMSIRQSVRDLRRTNGELAALRDSLEAANSELEGKVEQRTRAIRTILDHVSFGLLICDSKLRVQAGYSRSCREILEQGDKSIEGDSLPELLGLNARQADHFESIYCQIFDPDFLLGDLALNDVPNRFQLGQRSIGLTGSVVKADDGTSTGVLFCVADISSLVKAEEEIERNRSLIKMLGNRDSFRQFVHDVESGFARAYKSLETGDNALLRRELHTLKGNMGVFGLEPVARQIHATEDLTDIRKVDVKACEDVIVAFLKEHHELLGVTYGVANEDSFVIPAKLVDETERGASTAQSVSQLSELFADFFGRIRLKRARTILGPIEDSVAQLALRLGKEVRMELDGIDTLVPREAITVLKTLSHLLRNAIDHGIEAPSERGDKGPVGTIKLSVQEAASGLVLVISDDGRGIDRAAVAANAERKGYATKAQLAKMSDSEVYELIFKDGLSTASEVTDVSGRGVGMSAMKAAVDEVGGTIAIASRAGQGTTFTVTLPRASAQVGHRPRVALAS